MPTALESRKGRPAPLKIEDCLRLPELAQRASVHPRTAARWVDIGVDGVKLRCTYLGHERVTTIAWLNEFMDGIARVRGKK